MEQTLTQEQALSVLIQGVRLAQKAGAYTIEDAAVIANAIKVFLPKQEEGAPAQEAVATETTEA